jgi:hypothetical protein
VIDRIHEGLALTEQIDQVVDTLDRWDKIITANPSHPKCEERKDAWVKKLRVLGRLYDQRSEIEEELQDG